MKYPDLDDFARLLRKYPPCPAHRERRRESMKMINPIFRGRADMGSGYAPLVEYYRRRVDKVIREVRRTRVTTGVMVWKLHSSGFVFKTPKTVFSIDLIDNVMRSPLGNDLLQDPDVWDRPCEETPCGMCMTARQRQALAEQIDYAFHTHQHRDHISWDLARLTMAAGGKVIGTPGIRSAWARYGYGDKLVVLRHTDATKKKPKVNRIGPLQVRLHQGYQIGGGGCDTQCNAYVITSGSGVTVYAKGDTNDTSLYNWMVRAKSFGAKIDLAVGNISTGDLAEPTARLFDFFAIPGHDWDMIHGPVVKGTYWWHVGPWAGVYDQMDWLFARDRCELLTWGERYHFIPSGRAPKGALVLACAEEEVPGYRLDAMEGFFGQGRTCEPTTGSRWRWRGRTLEVRPPQPPGRQRVAFGVYRLDGGALRKNASFRTGICLAASQDNGASESFRFRVKVADDWGKEARTLYETSCDSRSPAQVDVPLDGREKKRLHLVLEVISESEQASPTAWLLNPYVGVARPAGR